MHLILHREKPPTGRVKCQVHFAEPKQLVMSHVIDVLMSFLQPNLTCLEMYIVILHDFMCCHMQFRPSCYLLNAFILSFVCSRSS